MIQYEEAGESPASLAGSIGSVHKELNRRRLDKLLWSHASVRLDMGHPAPIGNVLEPLNTKAKANEGPLKGNL